MRCIMGFCFVVAFSGAAWADETNFVTQQPAPPPPGVRTSVPDIQAPGAAAVANPSTTVQPGAVPAPTTTSYGNTVAGQPVRDDVNSCGQRAVLLLLSGKVHGMTYRTTVPGTLLLLDEFHTGLHYSHTDVLHDCSTGLSIRPIPSPVRSAHGLHNDGRDDTDLLHWPKLLLYAHDVHVTRP